jgi:hypothetical protein
MSIPIWNAVNKLAQHAEKLAARVERLEQAQQQPEPEPADDQTLHTVALHMVNELDRFGLSTEFQEIMRRAIREPMAEPAPSTPAGQGELVRSVAEAIRLAGFSGPYEPVQAGILAVVKWLESQAWRGAADALRREVGR